ncbi:unnamed protein product, partial [Vitis vinifera]
MSFYSEKGRFVTRSRIRKTRWANGCWVYKVGKKFLVYHFILYFILNHWKNCYSIFFLKLSHIISSNTKEITSSLKSDRRKKKFKKCEAEESEAKESETTEQKSQLPTKEASDFAKPVNVVFTFDKLLKFLEMLYNNI